ncbi:hypothetical protein AB834_03365 [PVC group bacterium (ex Bugula neritina AB1)]|nr:hypothetical protein AB834_03365 [PVC group bacterium (ex Bugula neritina AB1)]
MMIFYFFKTKLSFFVYVYIFQVLAIVDIESLALDSQIGAYQEKSKVEMFFNFMNYLQSRYQKFRTYFPPIKEKVSIPIYPDLKKLDLSNNIGFECLLPKKIRGSEVVCELNDKNYGPRYLSNPQLAVKDFRLFLNEYRTGVPAFPHIGWRGSLIVLFNKIAASYKVKTEITNRDDDLRGLRQTAVSS